VTIAESTVTLGLVLAKTIVSPDVFPKRAGVEVSTLLAKKRYDLNRQQTSIPPEDRFDFIYSDALKLLMGGLVLAASLCLFTAALPDIHHPNTLAFSCNGMVAYSGLLHGLLGIQGRGIRVVGLWRRYPVPWRVYRSIVADQVLMERIEKGEMVADQDTEYEIVEPDDRERRWC